MHIFQTITAHVIPPVFFLIFSCDIVVVPTLERRAKRASERAAGENVVPVQRPRPGRRMYRHMQREASCSQSLLVPPSLLFSSLSPVATALTDHARPWTKAAPVSHVWPEWHFFYRTKAPTLCSKTIKSGHTGSRAVCHSRTATTDTGQLHGAGERDGTGFKTEFELKGS